MWCILVITYMFNTFHAVSMGAIKQTLVIDFSLTESQFVFMTNMFSYTYMIMQIPVGIVLDKLGAKLTSIVGNSIAILGTIIFAIAPSFAILCVGRALIGLGCSVCFLSILKFCGEWLSEKIFCTMVGVTTLIGMSGALFAQTPLSILTTNFSIQNVFIGIAIFSAIIVLLEIIFIKNRPSDIGLENITANGETSLQVSIKKAVLGVLKNKNTWPPLITYGCFYGGYLIISGYYGTDMIASTYGISTIAASSCISYAVVGCAVGGVLIGWLSDKLHNRARVQIGFGVMFLASFVALWLALGNSSLLIISVIMFFLGFSSCAYSVCWSCVKEVNNPNFTGITTSIANMGGYIGSIIVPTVIGAIYTANLSDGGFASILISSIVVLIIGLVAAIFVKETKGENIYEN